MMRTTVTLDSDTEQIVRSRMAARGVSFKQALNDAIRAGADGLPRVDYHFPTYDMGVPTANLDRALQLAAELEDAELTKRLETGG